MDLYRENLLDHYKNPRNFGPPFAPIKSGLRRGKKAPILVWEEVNPSCGDRIGMALKLENGIVKDVRFWGEGCVVSMASASMLTEKIKKEHKSISSIKGIKGEDILAMLGGKEMIPPARLRCAFLSLEALRRALGVAKVNGSKKEKEVEGGLD